MDGKRWQGIAVFGGVERTVVAVSGFLAPFQPLVDWHAAAFGQKELRDRTAKVCAILASRVNLSTKHQTGLPCRYNGRRERQFDVESIHHESARCKRQLGRGYHHLRAVLRRTHDQMERKRFSHCVQDGGLASAARKPRVYFVYQFLTNTWRPKTVATWNRSPQTVQINQKQVSHDSEARFYEKFSNDNCCFLALQKNGFRCTSPKRLTVLCIPVNYSTHSAASKLRKKNKTALQTKKLLTTQHFVGKQDGFLPKRSRWSGCNEGV